MNIMLRSIRKLFKSLTNILGISYNIDKGKNANSSRAVLCVDVKKVNVFVKGLKRVVFVPNHYCSYCFKSIPAGLMGLSIRAMGQRLTSPPTR